MKFNTSKYYRLVHTSEIGICGIDIQLDIFYWKYTTNSFIRRLSLIHTYHCLSSTLLSLGSGLVNGNSFYSRRVFLKRLPILQKPVFMNKESILQFMFICTYECKLLGGFFMFLDFRPSLYNPVFLKIQFPDILVFVIF